MGLGRKKKIKDVSKENAKKKIAKSPSSDKKVVKSKNKIVKSKNKVSNKNPAKKED